MTNFKLLIYMIFILLSNSINAQWTWTGSTNSDWHTAANWNLNLVPFPGSVVYIFPNTPNDPIISSDVTVRSIFVLENAQLDIEFGKKVALAPYSVTGAVINYGTINNSGTIEIQGALMGSVENGIYNEGIFYNIASGAGVGGKIQIDNLDGRGIYLDKEGEFYNNGGTINIGTNQAVDGEGILVNDGVFKNTSLTDPVMPAVATINISNVEGNGIETNDIFTNTGGVIYIGADGPISKVGLLINAGTFTNQFNNSDPEHPIIGIINIDDTDLEGIENLLGTVDNYGTINLGKNTIISDDGVKNESTFKNYATGKIYIDRCKDGIFQSSQGEDDGGFYNYGEIHIGSKAAIEVNGIYNGSAFYNYSGGNIYVDNTGEDGLFSYSSGEFHNWGNVIIGSNFQISDNGFVCWGLVNNYFGATIQIDKTKDRGLVGSGEFINSGTIKIGENDFINGIAVYLADPFTNTSTGEIYIHRGNKGIFNHTNSFINKGLIEIGEKGTITGYAIHNNWPSASVITNFDCASIIHIHSDNDIYDQSNNITNNGLLITNSSGTSDIETNNGIIANLNQGTIDVNTDNGKTITKLGDKLWMGCSDTDWANAANWFPKEVPVANDEIYIGGITYQPTINVSTTAVGRTINIEGGATLTNNGIYDGFASIYIWTGGTLNGNGEYFLGGNWQNHGTFTGGTSKVTFEGQYASGIAGSIKTNFFELIIDKDNNWVLVQDDCSATDVSVVSGELVVQNNNTLSSPSITIESAGELDNRGTVITTTLTVGDGTGGTCTNEGSIEVFGDFQINSGSIAQGNGTYILLQDVINHGTFIPGTSTVELVGLDESQLLGTSDIDFWTVSIYKISTGKVTLGTDVTIQDLSFRNGDLLIPIDYQLTAKNCSLNSGVIENQGTLKILKDGFLNISDGTVKGNGTYLMEGSWFYANGFQRGTSKVIFTSSDTSYIAGSGTTTFYDLEIDNDGGLLETYQDFNVENDMVITAGELKIRDGTSVAGNHLTINSGKLTNDEKITLDSYLLNQVGGELSGSGQYILSGDWNNQGTFNRETSTVTFNGATTNTIEGNGIQTFYNLQINKEGNAIINSANNLLVENQVMMTNGDLDLDKSDLTLNGSISGESATSRIFGSEGGEIIKTVSLNNPSGENPGNLGVTFTSASNLGTTTIRRGSIPKATPTGDGFERYYNIEPTNDGSLNATLSFEYFDSENTALTEANLNPWQYTSNLGWMHYYEDNHDVVNNILTKGSLDEIGGIWTMAGDESMDNDGDGTSLADGDCDDTDSSNPTNLTLNDNPILEDYYIVPNTITSAGTIESGDHTTFEASTSITMKPGFTAQAGSEFIVRIGDCEGISPRISNLNTDETITINQELAQQQTVPNVPKEVVVQNSRTTSLTLLNAYPNPFTIETTITFELAEAGKVQLVIMGMQGQILQMPINGEVLAAGQHQQSFFANDLPAGMYLITLQTEKERLTKPVAIISK